LQINWYRYCTIMQRKYSALWRPLVNKSWQELRPSYLLLYMCKMEWTHDVQLIKFCRVYSFICHMENCKMVSFNLGHCVGYAAELDMDWIHPWIGLDCIALHCIRLACS